MSFITESKNAYKKVREALEKETSDHEISMARGELETIADRALATSAMLEGTPEDGNPLPAWVQSKITNACDYITTVHDYLKYNPRLNESLELTETTFEKIYQMQQDGKSVEDIAKELNLKTDLVKKVLGEQVELKEFNDAQIALLKKEFDPLKNKQISTARANQLSNILDKLDDGSLQKLRDALIPFVSAVSAAKLTTRKFKGVKITNVKVPGLEDMAEENQYVAVHTKKGKTSVTANSSYEAAKKASEKFGLKNTIGITVMLAKKDGEDVIHKATEEVEVTEEKIPSDYFDYLRTIVYKKIDFYEIPPKQIIQHWKDEPHKDRFKGKLIDYKEAVDPSKSTKLKMISIKGDQKEITIDKKDLEKYLKLDYVIKEYLPEDTANPGDAVVNMAKRLGLDNYGYARYGKDNVVTHRQVGGMLQKLDKPFKLDKPIKKEEVELKPVPSLEDSAKKHNVDIETLKKQLEKGIEIEKEHTNDEKTAEKIALAHIDERPDYYIQIDKLEKKPVEKVNEVKEPTGELKDACWTGYVAVGFKMKNGKRVPNCVPKSEAYKGAKKIVEKAFKKLKEKK